MHSKEYWYVRGHPWMGMRVDLVGEPVFINGNRIQHCTGAQAEAIKRLLGKGNARVEGALIDGNVIVGGWYLSPNCLRIDMTELDILDARKEDRRGTDR